MTLSTADRLEILDVITQADWAATRRDADAYVQLFTEDAVLDGGQGHHAGREALRASVRPIWAAEGKATLHLTLNPVVEDHGGPEAVSPLGAADHRPGPAHHHPHRGRHHPDLAAVGGIVANRQAHRRGRR